ncbi:MAG: hypothetical protein CMF96_10520 [Candidatus Marinimicrobia bacterium]|nr:hypothetical protein [Candidatus Neomarinimicrobiota bacterium]|tara:strand:- start:743 stop:1411 length:669 start_codon:yes stop_codon:yes gene_type:complete
MEKLIIIFLIGISYSETIEFMVSFLGFDAAEVSIKVEDLNYDGINAKSIIYETKTISGAKSIFPVDNYYQTILSHDLKNILYFEKNTSQPWLENNLKTVNIGNKIFYENTTIEIPTNYLNIFSLLTLVNYLSKEELLEKVFYLDREGRRYEAIFNSSKNTNDLLLELNILEGYKPLIDETDIFTWAVFREGAKRILKIKDNKLVYCEFSIGLVKMKAQILEK